MLIGIDIRSLLNPYQTGVGQFTLGLIAALHEHTDHTLVFYANAAKKIDVPDVIAHCGTLVHNHIPNKLMTTLSPFFNTPQIDRVIAKQIEKPIDLLFSPNIQYAPHAKYVPHVMTIHDLSFVHFPAYYTKRQQLWHRMHRVRYQVHRAAAIVVPSESTKDDVVRTYGVNADRVHVVSPGIGEAACALVTDDEKERVRDQYQLPKQFFFFLGTLEPRKNIDTLLEAYDRGGFAAQGVECIIAGAPGWNSEHTKETIERMRGVRYIGYVQEADKATLYSLATAFVYPSLYEGFGFPVLEAMAQGTPVITSNRTSLPEITHGAVRYVHPYRVHELVAALSEYREGKKNQMLIDIARTYTWERAAGQLAVVFCESVKGE